MMKDMKDMDNKRSQTADPEPRLGGSANFTFTRCIPLSASTLTTLNDKRSRATFMTYTDSRFLALS